MAAGGAGQAWDALAASALPLAVRDGKVVVEGFPEGDSSPLLTGLAPSLTSRGGGVNEDGCLVLGLDLGSGARPLAQADVAVGQVGRAGAAAVAARLRLLLPLLLPAPSAPGDGRHSIDQMFGSALMVPWPSNGCMKPCSFKTCT